VPSLCGWPDSAQHNTSQVRTPRVCIYYDLTVKCLLTCGFMLLCGWRGSAQHNTSQVRTRGQHFKI
jgi:hypothetical protein